MVRHQRNHVSVAGICVPVVDGTSESGGDDMPSTPRDAHSHWGQHPQGQIMMPSDMAMQRSLSAYVPHVPYDLGRQSLSSNGQDYHNGLHHEQAMPPRPISAAHIPQQYFMDANNPGVATMSANHFQHVQRHPSNAFSASDFSSPPLRNPIGNGGFGSFVISPVIQEPYTIQNYQEPISAVSQVPYGWDVAEIKYEDNQGFDLPSDRIDQID
ncbi:hypothetical protein VPNG_01282 [Cytospora leucostoma]|uniref:Uncharacterized protein n=1 Tax=Cytospora leucostoma TaxID=1230097 RepID=A0A423XLA9_9PEZI|nr:hypothetical protein VPNG_01282 [Cytospora leucostoma]